MSNPKRFLSRWWLLLALLSLAIVAVGCGGTTTAPVEPAATDVPASTESMSPTEAAVAKDDASTSQEAVTAATPVPMEKPVEAVVHPGKLILLTGTFGNERFVRAIGSGGNAHIGRIMGGYLSGTNNKNELLPGIATAWRVSPDGRTLTYTIREGVKFQDGSDLTAEDVRWTLAHTMSPEAIEAGVPLRGAPRRLSAAMESVVLSAPNEVSLTGIEPLPSLIEDFSEASTGWYHMVPKRDKIWDEEAAAAYDRDPVAAGKMRMVKHTPAYSLEFERFDDYYYQPTNGFPEDQRVKFQSLDMFLVPEEATRVAALEAGDADIIPVSLASRKRVEGSGGRFVFAKEGAFIVGWFFGCDRPGSNYPCRDKRVRQALDYAMPKELLRDTLWGPDVFEISGWHDVQPGTWAYFPELHPRSFDGDKARSLLAEAGYPGGEGFEKLVIHTRPAAVAPLLIESAQLVADSWRRELGIPVEVLVGEHAAIAQKRVNLELDGQMWWRENGIRLDPTNTLHSRWGDPESSWRATDDPALIARVQQLVKIVDRDERMAAFRPLLLDLQEETHYMTPGFINVPFGVGSRVLTWEPYSLKRHFSALHTITLAP
jgi:ABC-type transport system substrate-binding protein